MLEEAFILDEGTMRSQTLRTANQFELPAKKVEEGLLTSFLELEQLFCLELYQQFYEGRGAALEYELTAKMLTL